MDSSMNKKTSDLDRLAIVASEHIQERDYWLSKLSGEWNKGRFPYDNKSTGSDHWSEESFQFSPRVSADLIRLSRESDLRLHMVLVVGLSVLLYRYQDTGLRGDEGGDEIFAGSDIVVGVPILKSERVVDYINTVLVLRNTVSPYMTFKEVLLTVQQTMVEAMENQNYPVEILAQQLNRLYSPGGDFSLFDTALLLENIHDKRYLSHLGLSMIISVLRKGELIEGKVEYNASRYKQATVKRIAGYLESVLCEGTAHIDRAISELDILPGEERERLIWEFNASASGYPRDKTIQELFSCQVEKHPHLPAVVDVEAGEDGVRTVTYGQLQDYANRLAGSLVQMGIGGNGLVGIIADRSLEMIVGILGILNAGYGYVPLNPQAPSSRNRYLLLDCDIRVLLVASKSYTGMEWSGKVVFIKDYTGSPGTAEQVTGSASEVQVDSFAYVIFTSGSTGMPKGVPITHANFLPLLQWGWKYLGIGEKDRAFQNLSYYFDWSVWEIFITLTRGASLYITPGKVLLDPVAQADFIDRNQITVLHITPSQYSYLVGLQRRLETLTHLFIGAEKLTYDLVQRSFASVGEHCRVFNMYGPTEATIISAVLEINRDSYESYIELTSVPIGVPVGNMKLLVLDRYFNICPLQVPGELYIIGDNVSYGYLNNPELAARKFRIPQKYFDRMMEPPGSWQVSPEPQKSPNKSNNKKLLRGVQGGGFLEKSPPGRRRQQLYRTGDLARWLEDATVEYLGRMDHQVKIRGFRIELGEIENQLLSHQLVKEAVVIAGVREEKEGQENYLIGYVVLERDFPFTELREYLSQRLPDYMVPAYLIPLKQIPLTPNGKLDRKRLPEPDMQVGKEYIAPRDEVEKGLARIWAEILGIDTKIIGIDSDFFQLGGHSLKATALVYQVYKEFQVNIEIEEIFVHPTLSELADQVRVLEDRVYIEISPGEQREYYELSYAQRRLWVLCQFEEESTAYNIPGALVLNGKLSREMLAKAIRALAVRHESLRTIFISIDGDPYQRILGEVVYDLEEMDLRSLDGEAKEKKARAIYTEHANKAFNLEKAPLFQFKLIRLQEQSYLFMYNIHHIISDGWSQGIIHNELIGFYNSFLTGKENLLPPMRLQYKDYTYWHNHIIGEGYFNASREYWWEKFKDRPNGIELPYDYTRKPVQTFNGGRVVFTIDRERTSRLYGVSTEEDTTFFMGLLTLLCIFLYRYSGQTDIIIGAPIANRKYPELHHMTGFLVNTLIYRNRLAPAESFRELLGKVKQDALDSYKYQDYPFDLLVEQLGLDRDLSQSPLFNVMLAHNNTETSNIELEMEGVTFSEYPFSTDFNMSKFDLIFFMDELDDQVYTSIEYNSDLFAESTIRRMADNFLTLVDSVIAGSYTPIHQLHILSGSQYEQVITRFNDTGYVFPRVSIGEMFERQAADSGGKTAVVSNGDSLTYADLNKKVNCLAHYLRRKYHITRNDVIGVSLDRSLEMIVVLLGIIKAGAAYLAVDPTYPRERVLHVLGDSRSDLLIIDKMRPELFGNYTGEILNILESWEEVSKESAENPEPVNEPADILYVNYTSGSTGTPNGAMLSHDCLTNLIQWQNLRTTVDCSLRCLQFTSINFCVSFQEIVGTLTSGGELYLIGDIERQDIDYLMDFLSRNRIEVLFLPFSYLNFLFNESGRWDQAFNHNLKHIITAGEQLKITVGLKRFLDKNPGLQLHNHYGSTEMHVVTSYTLDASTAEKTPIPPAGKPISNVSIYILDEHLNPVPVGVWGELFVAGSSQVLGYINNTGLNQQKLVTHPWLSVRHNNQRLYRSGDIGRWMTDGNIELRGRKDFQVKIRGFRVEPGEIESRILSIENVRECVVVVKEESANQKYLAAYISVDDIDVADIKKKLSGELPQYMVPRLILLENLPLMHNGKVDREALPEPEPDLQREYTAPCDEMEIKLARIWADVLEIDQEVIGRDTDFFELGGHSLKATLLAARIYKEFHIKVPLTDIFKTPTIRGISQYMEESGEVAYSFIGAAEKRKYYQLSSAQKRFYILQQVDLDSTSYNIPAVFKLEGKVDREKLAGTFRGLIRRHESLRTSFFMIGDESVQAIHPEVEFEIEYHFLGHAGDEGHLGHTAGIMDSRKESSALGNVGITRIIKNFIRSFDLSRAPLLRVGLLRIEDEQHLLMVDIHHIISDGTTISVLMKEFTALYGGQELALPLLQYKDIVLWQRSEKEKAALETQETYWLKEFPGEIPVLALPIDQARPAVQKFEGATLQFEIGRQEQDALNALALREGATLFMVLLSLYNILLSRLSGQEEIVVGTPVAGRRHAELEQIVGVFINTLPLKNNPSGTKSFVVFLNEVKENTLQAFTNQDYPYEDLVEKLEVERDAGRNPLFDVMFVFQNFDAMELKIPGLKLAPYRYETKTAKVDMLLAGMEVDQGISFVLEYSTSLYEEATIKRFIDYFKIMVSSVAKDNSRIIGEIDILPEEEKRKLLYEFNDSVVKDPLGKAVNELFAEQAARTPDRTALVETAPGPGSACLSFRALNQGANRLGRLLQNRGIKTGTRVGIMIERSLDVAVAILAVLKAGGTYLPIDPDYPGNRIALLVKNSDMKLLLSVRSLIAKKWDNGPSFSHSLAQSHVSLGQDFDLMAIDEQGTALEEQSPENLARINKPDDLIYIIFTSGSTGIPKGAGVYHRGFTNLMHWFVTDYQLQDRDRTLLLTSLSFDLTQRSFYTPLVTGGTLCLPAVSHFEPSFFIRTIWKEGITWVNCTPGIFYALVEYGGVERSEDLTQLSSLRYVFLGGEPINISYLLPWMESAACHAEVYNIYGPTECTDISASYRIERPRQFLHSVVPVGRPVYNVQLYIVDKYLRLVPVGVVGELLIAGAGVGAGYINDNRLTEAKFILHRFEENQAEQLVYRTGDLARRRADGNIEFLGRSDHQVKVRGFRVETGEVESQLLRHEQVKDAVVIVGEGNDGDHYLCAYIVPQHPQDFQESEIRNYLAEELPDYMVPSYFMVLESIPLNPHGKVDRKALPEPGVKISKNYVAPGNEIERIMVRLWSELLQLDKDVIGVHDNFFHLGGHSLKATAMISRLHKEFQVRVQLADVFKYPVIRSLAKRIKGMKTEQYISIRLQEEKEYYQTSYSQKRLWLLNQNNAGGSTFNMPGIIPLDQKTDIHLVKRVLNQIIKRHDSFRTGFRVVGEQLVQVIKKEIEIPFKTLDLSSVEQPVREQKRQEIYAEELSEPFDLRQMPLFRTALLKLGEEKYELLFNMHHIITDGWSMELLEQEFTVLYKSYQAGAGIEPGPLPVRYIDYAGWQEELLASPGKMKGIKEFWESQLKGDCPVLDLPYDFPKKGTGEKEGDKESAAFRMVIPAGIVSDLRQIAVEYKASLFMVLLAGYNMLLYRLSGQEDILLAVPGAARQHEDLKQIVGFFVNTLILRNKINPDETFIDFLLKVQDNTLRALEYQSFPLELICREYKIRYPEISVFLNMLTFEKTPQEDFTGIETEHIDVVQEAKFDLVGYLREYRNGLVIETHYYKGLFKPMTIEKIMQLFLLLLQDICTAPGKKVREFKTGLTGKKRKIKSLAKQELE